MRNVAIIGIGQTPVGEHWNTGLRALAAQAAREAIENAGSPTIDALYIANAFGGSINHQSHIGALVTDFIGLSGIETFAIEAAEASGGAALRTAYLAVASGLVNTALVVGVEKMTDSIAAAGVKARSTGLDADYEAAHGATLPALAALLMRRYIYENQLDISAFEGFSINAHANGSRSQNAMFRNVIKPGRFASAPIVADPVNLFDGAPDADGAAALVLTAAERAGDMVPQPVRITGSAASSDTLALHDRTDPLYLKAAYHSALKAYQQARVQPQDIDLFELHDAFTILSTLTLEATGFAKRGEGWKLAQDGHIALTGSIPISTFGGLKSRGNPAGATGIYQAAEAVLQLQGDAGANQVEGARTAMLQNLGGLGSTAITHILQI
ncbi:MAG: thiolase domain-containing protein [Anaerolineae bacterium]|nr:thiolase domain-containing protein [Anaerolineae bacterium]